MEIKKNMLTLIGLILLCYFIILISDSIFQKMLKKLNALGVSFTLFTLKCAQLGNYLYFDGILEINALCTDENENHTSHV